MYQGQVLGTYHKTMLTSFDKKYFATDWELPVFEAKGIKFGVITCHSSSFVEPAQYLRWKGARLLFTPHFNRIAPEGWRWQDRRVTFWEHRTKVLNNHVGLASLLNMVVVRSNIVGVDEHGLAAGDSNIWDMNGVLVAQGTPFTECVVTARFEKRCFLEKHWIDMQEVPAELSERVAAASRAYPRSQGV